MQQRSPSTVPSNYHKLTLTPGGQTVNYRAPLQTGRAVRERTRRRRRVYTVNANIKIQSDRTDGKSVHDNIMIMCLRNVCIGAKCNRYTVTMSDVMYGISPHVFR